MGSITELLGPLLGALGGDFDIAALLGSLTSGSAGQQQAPA